MVRPSASRWFGWGNLLFCLALYAGMWYFYGLIRPLISEMSAYTIERTYTFGPVIGFCTIGALILAYRPWHRVGLVFSLVGATQVIFGAFSGRSSSPIIIVISTLTIAAIFNPLRHRIQEFIDKRFYRQKYNAEQAIARFADIARNQTDLEAVSDELRSIIQTSLQPEHLSLRIRP